MTTRTLLSGCLGLFLAIQSAQGQNPTPPTEPDIGSQVSERQTTLNSLKALHRSIQAKKKERRDFDLRIAATSNAHDRAELVEDSIELEQEVDALEKRFARFALSVDTSVYDGEEDKTIDLKSEFEKLVQPILSELKEATATSRKIDALRTDLEKLDAKAAVANEAVNRLTLLTSGQVSEPLAQPLTELQTLWTRRQIDAANQREASQIQLDRMMANRKSVFESTQSYVRDSFRTRGKNLFFGVFAFCCVFFGLRGIYLLAKRIGPFRQSGAFTSRLLHLLFHAGTTVAAVCATLVVFNMAGDWFLLGIVILFLLGVGWASINTIPQHLERIKLMLNVGPVRESERILFDGIPWQVNRLGFSAHLTNPLLEGGNQILPIKCLIDHHSRIPGQQEEWFPSRCHDWVELDDGVFGRVSYQTPSIIQLVQLGGTQVTYSTANYLALNPRNFTTGFRIETTFGVDYQHQAESSSTLPDTMKTALQEGLQPLCGDALLHIDVRLSSAAASSLDYRIVLDLDGQAARNRDHITDAVTRLLVEACNENNWVIPFQQVTIHRAET